MSVRLPSIGPSVGIASPPPGSSPTQITAPGAARPAAAAMRFTVHFTVTLSEPLPDDQFVFVTGNAEQLGQWDPQRAFRLQPTPQR